MQTSAPRIATALMTTLTLALLAPWGAAQGQLNNLLNQAGGTSGSTQNALGSLGGLSGSMSSITSSSLGNVTGVLQYCIKNNYLNADAASNIKNSLLGKLPGGENTTDSGYTQGTSGILTTGNGQKLDLSAAGLKETATKQVCDKILSQAKSML
jgi:hypothetical protein